MLVRGRVQNSQVLRLFLQNSSQLRPLSCRKMSEIQQDVFSEKEPCQNAETSEEKLKRTMRDIYKLTSANLRFTEDSTPTCAKVIHPGFSPESMDRNGNPSLISILQTGSVARIFAMHMPINNSGKTFIEYEHLTSKGFTFISASQLEISPHMYNGSVPLCPLEIKVEGGHIGRTSVSTVSSMVSPADPQRRELFKQINQVVIVSRETRRPIPLEDKWRELYGPHCVRGEPLIIKAQDTPQSGPLSIYEVKIAWSDTDNYNHTNFASYPRFALDAIHDALKHGKLEGHLSEADFFSGVAQVKMAYLGESVEGDVLEVNVWCPENMEQTVVCSMEKAGQKVNQVTLTFYSATTRVDKL